MNMPIFSWRTKFFGFYSICALSLIALFFIIIDNFAAKAFLSLANINEALPSDLSIQKAVNRYNLIFLSFSLIVFVCLMVLSGMMCRSFMCKLKKIISSSALGPLNVKNKESQGIDDSTYLKNLLDSVAEKIEQQAKTCSEQQSEKELILEFLSEGIVVVDHGFKIAYANLMGSKMLGFPKRYLLGRIFSTVLGKSSKVLLEKCQYLLGECQNRKSVVTDSLFMGETYKIYVDIVAIPLPYSKGAILILQDNSSHYKVLEMGKDFVANASHELRTPITIIKGFAETLQDLPELSFEMLADITEKIVRNCQRMDSLVKNLLTLADIENLPSSRFQECDLVALIENCRDLLLSIHPHANVKIETNNASIAISADPDILELAIMNLLENAVKYSPPPATIGVIIEELENDVKVMISDRGIGIPSQDIEHVFNRFYTVDKARSRRLGGAGLGLSIVRTIVEKHDGTISVSSELGKGSTFTLLLPVHRLMMSYPLPPKMNSIIQ
jgi:two-component system, OmpR family, phosphate regulon sensor histidine kinase PhoR